MSRISIDKDLLDGLADSIGGKFDEDTPLTVTEQKSIIDGITKRSSTDLSASGAMVTAPAGYYGSSATKTISSGSATPASSITASTSTPSAQNSKLRLSATASNTPQVSAGYIATGTAGNTSIMVDTDIPYYNSNSPITINGNTVSVPRGFFSGNVSKTVPYGTEGTPTATKGTVSNHQVSVTPSVTNTAGYISGSTKTGTVVTVTASELASGNKEITQNGTGIDVVGYSTVSVGVSSDVYVLHYGFATWDGPVTFEESYADTKAAIQNGKAVVFMAGGLIQAGVIEGVTTTSFTFDGITFSEGIRLYVSVYANPNEMFQVAWGYVNGSITTHCIQIGTAVPTGTIPISDNGTVNVSAYEYASVNVQPSYTATISGTGYYGTQLLYVRTGSSSSDYTYYYTDGDTFTFKPGDSIYCRANDRSWIGYIYVNGVRVAYGTSNGATYTYTASTSDIEVLFSGANRIDINTLGLRPVNITVNASSISGTMGIPTLIYVKHPDGSVYSDRLAYTMTSLYNDVYPFAVDSVYTFVGYAPFNRTISSMPYLYIPDSEYRLAMLAPNLNGVTFSGNIDTTVYYAPDLYGMSTPYRLISGDFTMTYSV